MTPKPFPLLLLDSYAAPNSTLPARLSATVKAADNSTPRLLTPLR